MSRILPSFADLMLLPEQIDPTSEVRLEDDRIVVRSSRLGMLRRALEAYPHVAARRHEADELVLEPLAMPRARVVLLWPGGETVGVTVWPDGYVSLQRGDAIIDAALQGDGVALIHCREGESLADALEALDD